MAYLILLALMRFSKSALSERGSRDVGTYMVAVLARRHNIPFYVACPLSTIDLNIASGTEIPIEERAAEEVTGFRGCHHTGKRGYIISSV